MRPHYLLFLFLLATSCARYEFDLLEPKDLARHVGRTEATAATVVREPVEYRMQAAEGRLTMRVTNMEDEPIELLGDRSYVVDPKGQSHPLRSQSIAPHSFIRLVFPPLRPWYRPSPSFGFGIGIIAEEDLWHDQPYYLAYYDDSAYYCTWDGDAPVRIRIVYQRGKGVFDHEFTFRRQKL